MNKRVLSRHGLQFRGGLAACFLVCTGFFTNLYADIKGYSVKVTFDNFSGRGTLTDFPGLVKLTTSSTNSYAGFLDITNGYDLRFWDTGAFSGNELNYEIESFDSSGNSYIWVQVPTLTHNASIYATWGDSTYNNQASYLSNGDVWGSEYKGVWHLGEADSMATDSTVNGNDAESINGTPFSTNGQIGLATDFNDATDDRIIVPASPLFDIGNNFSISAWIFNRNPSLGEAGIAGTHATGWIFGFDDVAPFENLRLYDGTWRNSGNAVSSSVWTHVAYTFENGVGGNFYIDGVEVGTTAGSTRVTTGKLHIGEGGPSWGGRNLEGIIDELRIESTTRPENWLWACFMNQGNNHSSFVSYGPVTTIETEVSSLVITATTTVPLSVADYGATLNYNATGAANIKIDFSTFGTGVGNGMDLSACSSDPNDYAFSGLTTLPNNVTIDNSNKTIFFEGGNTQPGTISISNAVQGVGWKLTNTTAGTNSVIVTVGSASNTYDLTLEPDTTSPTLVSITEDQTSIRVPENSTILYTVTFSEGMDSSTITSGIFENATGNSTISIGAITTSTNISFTVPVTPTSTGNLQLQIKSGSGVTDTAGNPLNTTPAWTDDTVFDVWAPPERRSTYSIEITFENLSGIGSLSNFPTLVQFNTNNTNNYEGFVDTTSGNDLRFWDNATFTGNELSYETEAFDSSGNSFIWVRIPTFTDNTSIWATWGDSAYNFQEDYTTNGNVWSSEFKGVWHLGEADNLVKDSTSNSHDADTVTGAPLSTEGHISLATDFNNGTADHITVPNSTDFDIGTSFTISAWVSYRNPLASSEDSIAGTFNAGWIFGFENSGNWDQLQVYNNSQGWISSGNTVQANTWNYVVYTFEQNIPSDATDGKFFHDGVFTASKDGEPITSTNKLHIGAGGPAKVASARFNGIIDELRIESATRSSEWVEACYKTQGPNHSTYVSYGTVVPPPRPKGTIFRIE